MIRLLKVIVQPVFVIDDGESLREARSEPVEVQGADWAEFAKQAFSLEEIERLQSQLEGDSTSS